MSTGDWSCWLILRLVIESNGEMNFENKDISVIKESLHLAHFGITNIEKNLCKYWDSTQDLTECSSRKHWNNIFWLAYDNNYIEYY